MRRAEKNQSTRSERINFRVSFEDKAFIEDYCRAKGKTLAEYFLGCISAARRKDGQSSANNANYTPGTRQQAAPATENNSRQPSQNYLDSASEKDFNWGA